MDIFKDFYGEENFTPGEHEDVDDEYYYPLYADGEAWELVEHMQFFEDDDYILFILVAILPFLPQAFSRSFIQSKNSATFARMELLTCYSNSLAYILMRFL